MAPAALVAMLPTTARSGRSSSTRVGDLLDDISHRRVRRDSLAEDKGPDLRIWQVECRFEGLPLDREPTLDNVRGSEGSGRSVAVDCTALVVLVLGAFWIWRALRRYMLGT